MGTLHILLVILLHIVASEEQQLPVCLPPKVVMGGSNGICPSTTDVRDEINQNVSSIIRGLGLYSCGGTSGWRRVGYLDMTDPSQSCPSGLALKTYTPGVRSCGKVTDNTTGCWSTFYDTGDTPYSRVCGRVRGYQYGLSAAFFRSFAGVGISSDYMDGVSLTHGPIGGRTHIWTFAAGPSQVVTNNIAFNAYCTCESSTAPPPPVFVGSDYFCESGLTSAYDNGLRSVFHVNNPLWDGQGCIGNSNCCHFSNPPYFTKTLPVQTTDSIELRTCSYYQGFNFNVDVPIDQVELYVQ